MNTYKLRGINICLQIGYRNGNSICEVIYTQKIINSRYLLIELEY